MRMADLSTPSRRDIARRAAVAALAATCAAVAFYWQRYALLPPELNANVVRALGLAWVGGIALGAWRRPGAATLAALCIAAVDLLPLDLWPAGVCAFALLPWSLPRGARWPVRLVAPLLAVPLLLYTSNERIYGALNTEAVAAIMQTRTHEAATYVRQLFTPGVVLAWCAYVAALVAGTARTRAEARPRVHGMLLATAALVVCLPGTVSRALVVKNALHEAPDAAAFAPPPAGARIDDAHRDLDVVLLLGEATARRYWSLYGFPAATTPGLSARASELAVFADVVSPYSHTVPSLRAMMYRDTPASRPAGESRAVSLIDLLRQAGARVEWYSAQERMGFWALPVTRLAEGADHVEWLNQQTGFGFAGADRARHPDRLAHAALLKALGQPAAGPRLLVHHFFAGHAPYCGHVPDSPVTGALRSGAAYFGDGPDFSGDVACYANAMRLVDQLVTDTLEAARRAARPTVVLFVPDHGEAPDLGLGHNAQRFSSEQVEIPFVAWMNDAARRTRGDAWQHLRENQGRAWENDWLFELLLDLYGLPGDGLLLRAGSPASGGYQPAPRLLFPEDRRWDVDRPDAQRHMDILADARLQVQAIAQAGAFDGTVFAHRVDSQGKALAARDRFPGVEMDIDYDEAAGSLQVFHPPKPPVGLSLDDQLATLAARPALRVWLDMKNVTPGNAAGVIAALARLDARWGLRPRALVELPEGLPEAVFDAFGRAGWQVSMYLPDDLASCNARPADDAACAARARRWLDVGRRVGNRYFSFDFGSWPAVRTFLAPGLAPGQALLSWNLQWRIDRPDLVARFQRLPRLAGMIVPFPTAWDR